MPIKKIRDSSQYMYNKLTINGEVIRNTPVLRTDQAFAEAIFRRKKPNPLTNTPFRVLENVYNATPYHRSYGDTELEGTLIYVYGSEPIKRRKLTLDGLFALNKARAKISGANQDLGESLVELDQTIKMLQKNLDRLGKIGDALKNGEWSKLDSLIKGKTPDSVKRMKPSKRLASGYLEISFGWMPLLSSAHTAVEAYGKGMLTRGSKVSAVSGQKKIDMSKGLSSSHNVGRATFTGTVKNSNIATLNSYGLINPVLMAWQRVPYSFVFDWFIPIGPILGSLTAEAGLEGVLQSYTDVVFQEEYNKYGWNYRSAEYLRKVPGALPPIGNPFGRPAQLSIGKLISSVALLRQRFN